MNSGIRQQHSGLPAVLIGLLAGCWCAPAAMAQNAARRDFSTPGLMLNTGGRTGPCDVLSFSPDGKYLLATGDDKIVRNWRFTPKGLAESDLPVLRWSLYRENRGAIYAMAFSPKDGGREVVFTGRHIYTNGLAVVVADRETGEIKHALKNNLKGKITARSCWALAWSPSGKFIAIGADDGNVYLWEPNGPPNNVRLVGTHDLIRKGGQGTPLPLRVKFLIFSSDNNFVYSIAENGQVKQWDLRRNDPGRELFRFGGVTGQVLYVPKRQWFVAAVLPNVVEVRSFPQGQVMLPPLRLSSPLPGSVALPESIAVDPAANRLAVGVRVIDQNPKTTFLRELDHGVWIYKLAKPWQRPVKTLPVTYRPKQVAFHPANQDFLAVAGGDNHEVSLWDLNASKRVSNIAGEAKCIWNVRLSQKGRYLAFQTQRAKRPDHPNRRGAGQYTLFDLEKLKFLAATPKNTKFTAPLETMGGWKVLTSAPGRTRSSFQWYITGPGYSKAEPIPMSDFEGFPNCWTFLPQTATEPVRLVVGHYWGASVYQCRPGKKPQRTRILRGHEGEVVSLVPTSDLKRLVMASRDQTITGWSLEPWPSHPTLGGRFVLQGGKLLVNAVDQGSPAWEMGLSTGDEIVYLYVKNKGFVFNHSGLYGGRVGTPAIAKQWLDRATPGVSLNVGWRRAGFQDVLKGVTNIINRPIWRFLPAGREWALWRWRDHFYATSFKGDSLLGWQRSYEELNQKPVFYSAEQMRAVFHKPEKVKAMLQTWKTSPDEILLPDLEPPKVTLVAPGAGKVVKINNQDLTLRLSAKVQNKLPGPQAETNQSLIKTILWINDFQYKVWIREKNTATFTPDRFAVTETIPRKLLRSGTNVITLQCYNRGEARGEATPIRVDYQKPLAQRRLHGLFIGAGDYRKSVPKQLELQSHRDAKVLEKIWLKQKGKLFNQVNIRLVPNDLITRDNVFAEFDRLQKDVQPDDLLVFYLGGHGTTPQELREKAGVKEEGLGQFLFLCPTFNIKEVRNTTVNFEELYDKLIRLPCHKVLLIDTCHSGASHQNLTSKNHPLRLLMQDGIGPVILAACEPEENANEVRNFDASAYGLFTVAIRRTLEENDFFTKADKDKSGTLVAHEMADAIRKQVRDYVRLLKLEEVEGVETQNPVAYLPRIERDLPLANR